MRKQIALCIGNDNYQYSCFTKLKCAVNDATAISKKLEQLNYNVSLQCDLSSEEMYRAIDEFESKLPEYDVALFYYAGHGFEIEGENLLMPIDTQDGENKYKKRVALTLNAVIDAMEGKSIKNTVKTKIIILDACRQNLASRGGDRGFAPIFAPVGTIIAFATSPGQLAYESNGHGRYTEALIKFIDTPRIPIENMFKHVRETVAAQTHGNQISWEHTSLMGNYNFNEDRIDSFSIYSNDALADENYLFAKNSEIGIIVNKLKSHDWNIQNPAINDVSKINWIISSANDLFVLGRNIYQAANGGAWKVQRFIKDFPDCGYIPFEARVHILNGMAYEIYYDRQGQIRQNFKAEFYLDVVSLLENEKYLTSRNFILSKLINEGNRLLYIPSSEERMEFCINLKEHIHWLNNEKIFIIDSIYYQGQNVFFYDEDHSEYSWSRTGSLINLKYELAKQIVGPPDMITIKYNMSSESDNRIAIPIRFF